MKLKALIFDVDGTLAETEKDGHRVAFNLAFKSANLDWNWDVNLYGELLEIAGGKERLKYYINKFKTDFNSPYVLDNFIINLHQQKSKNYRELLNNNAIPLRTGVKRLITEAHQARVKLAIASTAAVDNVKALLDNSFNQEMASWFQVISAGDMVKNKKPAPDVYLLALEKLGLNPLECLAIEDTEQGLLSANQANLKTVITINEYTKNQNFHQASLVINNLGEPDQFFTVIQGNNYEKNYFNIDLANLIVNN
jgi:HAD superfamily hydrolase (TIGR01509 family)